MIEAVLAGGWKSILTAALLLLMSVMSLSSMLAEIIRLNREIANVPTDHDQATGIWEIIRDDYRQAVASGLRGKALKLRLENIAGRATMKGGGHATILATVGSNAPYIGLLGTVLGIYSALKIIGVGITLTPDRLAAPVGEALVMTALGLLVAIPAVLGFNYICGRRARLTQMAEAYLVWLSTGSRQGAHMRTLERGQHTFWKKRNYA